MIINETLIKYIFNKNNFIRRALINLVLILAICTITVVVIINSYRSVYEYHKDIIYNTKISYNYNISDESNLYKDSISRCIAIKCERIVLKDTNTLKFEVYETEFNKDTQYTFLKLTDEVFSTSAFTKYLTPDFRLIIYGDNAIYIMDDNTYLESNLQTITIMLVVSVLIIIAINYMSTYASYKNDIYEKKNYKTYIENKLQGNVMEMIHHEINTPLSILVATEDAIKDIFAKCSTDKISKDELDRVMTYYNYSVKQITETISFLAKSKHIKRDDTIPILKSFEHIVHSINATHIIKLNIEYNNCKDILDSYIINPNLSHAGFMNVITVLFNNSIEAGANLITVSLAKLYNNYMCLDIKDNGRGIRDTNGDLFKDSGKIIQEYGYSTKDDKGKQIIKTGFLYKLLKFLHVKIISTDTTRGIGLYMNKILLENVGGKIWLIETSENGTTFRVKIPVQKKK